MRTSRPTQAGTRGQPDGGVAAIDLRGLSKVYPDGTRAVRDVSLSVEGGLVGLLGPNGAGKTTLLALIVLALEPTAGSRTYFGLSDGVGNRGRIRPRLGYLPQEFEPLGSLSGREYLETCTLLRTARWRGRRLRDRVGSVLDRVDLGEAADRLTREYSGGMKRRLGLAQALIHSPDLLVVDEPTAGLDPEERTRFRSLIAEVADLIPVLLSTHIVEDVEATCPRLLVLAGGRVGFDGAPARLIEAARGRLWQMALDATTGTGRVIGRRAGVGEGAEAVVLSDRRPQGEALPVEPSLEEAYAAFLASQPGPLEDPRPSGHRS